VQESQKIAIVLIQTHHLAPWERGLRGERERGDEQGKSHLMNSSPSSTTSCSPPPQPASTALPVRQHSNVHTVILCLAFSTSGLLVLLLLPVGSPLALLLGHDGGRSLPRKGDRKRFFVNVGIQAVQRSLVPAVEAAFQMCKEARGDDNIGRGIKNSSTFTS